MGEQVHVPRDPEERGEMEAGGAGGQAPVGLCSEV